MNWWTYVQEVTNGAAQEKVAQKVGVTGPTVNRWQRSAPKPETVAAFARAYGRPVLEAFIAAGFLTPEEARAQVSVKRAGELDNLELLEALGARLGLQVGFVGTRSQLDRARVAHLQGVSDEQVFDSEATVGQRRDDYERLQDELDRGELDSVPFAAGQIDEEDVEQPRPKGDDGA
ncbi:hypothetical protein [Cellulosimicrobium funkei]|uniref:hypothetical protein n=1 Tax=Cellulosimicrobium funkei TaxID=264251 RepID=UPI0037DC6944